MKQTVYVDVLLFLNLIIAFLLLKSAALLSGVPASRIRLFFGTITGSAASLLIFVQMNPIESILTKLMLGLSLSGIVFLKRKNTDYSSARFFHFCWSISFLQASWQPFFCCFLHAEWCFAMGLYIFISPRFRLSCFRSLHMR